MISTFTWNKWDFCEDSTRISIWQTKKHPANNSTQVDIFLVTECRYKNMFIWLVPCIEHHCCAHIVAETKQRVVRLCSSQSSVHSSWQPDLMELNQRCLITSAKSFTQSIILLLKNKTKHLNIKASALSELHYEVFKNHMETKCHLSSPSNAQWDYF